MTTDERIAEIRERADWMVDSCPDHGSFLDWCEHCRAFRDTQVRLMNDVPWLLEELNNARKALAAALRHVESASVWQEIREAAPIDLDEVEKAGG